jgi:phosphoglucosamine mutase
MHNYKVDRQIVFCDINRTANATPTGGEFDSAFQVWYNVREGGFTLGGEQSGHIIFSRFATTGDGILTGLMVAAEVKRTGKSLTELAAQMKTYPQVLLNIKGVDKTRVETDLGLQEIVKEAETELGDTGRVLLRASGTENLVRVMVEAADEGTAHSWADRIARVVEKNLAI